MNDHICLEQSDSYPDSADHPDIVLDPGGEDAEAAAGVDLHGGLRLGEVEHAAAAAGDGGEAAGVGDVVEAGEGDVAPVEVLLGAAAVQLARDTVCTFIEYQIFSDIHTQLVSGVMKEAAG